MNIMEDNNKIAATDARFDKLFEKISVIIEQSRQFVKTAVNIAEVKARYEVGRYIFEDEQQGGRAAYGKQTIPNLSSLLIEKYGDDWTIDTLTRCRKFFKAYQDAVILATTLPKFNYRVLRFLGHTIWYWCASKTSRQGIPKDANVFATQYALYLPDKQLLQAKLKQWIDEFNNAQDPEPNLRNGIAQI